MKNLKKHLLSILCLAILLTCCDQDSEVIITKDYVVNPNWDEIDNDFIVYKMNIKDSDDNIFPESTTPAELLLKLEKDMSYSFVANVKYNGEDYSERKVFFNKNNGFSWGKISDINYERKILGDLEQNTWYLLAGLSTVKTLYFVHIDTLNAFHSYKVPASLWTNY